MDKRLESNKVGSRRELLAGATAIGGLLAANSVTLGDGPVSQEKRHQPQEKVSDVAKKVVSDCTGQQGLIRQVELTFIAREPGFSISLEETNFPADLKCVSVQLTGFRYRYYDQNEIQLLHQVGVQILNVQRSGDKLSFEIQGYMDGTDYKYFYANIGYSVIAMK